jgi:hypothetical protein
MSIFNRQPPEPPALTPESIAELSGEKGDGPMPALDKQVEDYRREREEWERNHAQLAADVEALKDKHPAASQIPPQIPPMPDDVMVGLLSTAIMSLNVTDQALECLRSGVALQPLLLRSHDPDLRRLYGRCEAVMASIARLYGHVLYVPQIPPTDATLNASLYPELQR